MAADDFDSIGSPSESDYVSHRPRRSDRKAAAHKRVPRTPKEFARESRRIEAREAAEERKRLRPASAPPPRTPPTHTAHSRSPVAIAVAWAILLAAIVVVGAATVVAVRAASRFVAGRPLGAPASAKAVVSVVPSDTLVVFGTSAPATGSVETTQIKPAVYTVRASRKGFETLVATLACNAGTITTKTFTLRPLPIPLTVSAHPKKARYEIVGSDGTRRSGTLPFSGRLPAGETVVTVSASGRAGQPRRLFLDAATRLDAWLDPAGQLVRTLNVFGCVPAPKGVAVTPDGSQVWVTALVTQPSVAAYDVGTGRMVGKVNLGGSGAVEVAFNRDGTKAYASQMQSASVFEIDARTFKVLRQLKTGSSWTKVVTLSPDETRLYAANWSGDDISEIDLVTGKLVRRMPTVDTPRGVWPTADGRRLFIAGFGEQSLTGRLAVIDLATGTSRTFFTEKGGAMRHMVADEKRGVVFTSDMGKACIWVTDMRTLKTRRLAKTDSHPNTIDISPDGRVLFVSCRGANNPKSYYIPGPEWGSVLLLDTVTGKPLDAIIGGNQCTALDLSGDGTTLVFSDFLDNRLRMYAIPDYATLAAGNGGRYTAHLSEIRKPGWGGVSGGSGTGGGD